MLAEGHNSVITDADPTGHAETNWSDCPTVRLSGGLAREVCATATPYTSTEPCAMCAGAIYWSGSARMVFALSEAALAEMVAEEDGVPPLRLPSREVFARGGREIVVTGPADLISATEVHRGLWD